MSSSPPSPGEAADPSGNDRTHRRRVDQTHNGRLRWAMILVLLAGTAFVYACDTVARISFPNRTLTATHTAGFTLPSDACGNPKAAGHVQLRFAFVDSEDSAVRPLSANGSPLQSGPVDISASDITFNNSGVFEYPDLPCPPDETMADAGFGDAMSDTGSGGNGNGSSVPSNSALARKQSRVQCSVNTYSCRVPPGIDNPSVGDRQVQRCFKTQQLDLGNEQVEFISDVKSDQLFGVMVENSGSTVGRNPTDMTEGYDAHAPWEAAVGNSDPRTATGGPVGTGSNPAIATDEGGVRFNTVRSIISNWDNVQDNAAADGGRKTHFGLWGIQGSSSPTSYVNSATDDQTFWTGDGETANSAQSELQSADPGPTNANIYEALNSVVQNRFSDGNCPNGGSCDKTLVLIVDGPSNIPLKELRGSGQNVGGVAFDTVRQNLVDKGVRLFIVHYDPNFNIGENDRNYLALDNPAFYTPQTECSDDSDCFHHQTCRKVDGYASSSGGQISVPDNPHGTYCMPVRGSDGRIGPIGLYSRLACATGGTYLYRKANDAISPAAQWLPYSMDGLWQVSVPFETLGGGGGGSGIYTRGQPIQLQTEVTYQLTDTTQGQSSLTQQGNNLDQFDARDTRSVIMTGESSQ